MKEILELFHDDTKEIKPNNEDQEKDLAFIDYSQTIHNVCENLEGYNQTKKIKVLIVFDDMITDMESNEKSHNLILNCLNL